MPEVSKDDWLDKFQQLAKQKKDELLLTWEAKMARAM
jgi:hypothetical protein